MAKEKFNWKGLFVNEVTVEENVTESKESKSPAKTTFPETEKPVSKFPENLPQKPSVPQDVLDNIVAMYESGFESLNQPGYDFYEFFKAIEAVGTHDAQVYKMAMTMAQTVNKKVTKDTLLIHADYYITEINKVHDLYLSQGNEKKTQIQSAHKIRKENLSTEVSSLEKKLLEIQKQIESKKNELQSIDAGLVAELTEIDQKISCNDIAKTKIQDAILTVVNGIKKNL